MKPKRSSHTVFAKRAGQRDRRSFPLQGEVCGFCQSTEKNHRKKGTKSSVQPQHRKKAFKSGQETDAMYRTQQRQTPSWGSRSLTLPVQREQYGTDFHFLSYRPREIGCVSVNAKGRFPNDTKNKRYLRLDARPVTNVNWDLMMGYHDRYIKMNRLTDEGKLDGLLRWCLASGEQLQAEAGGGRAESSHTRPLNFDFVARRGHLTKMIITPYATYSWKMAVTLFRGTYFLLEERDEEGPRSERDERINYMGHKFEHYMTSAKPHQEPDPSAVLDDNEAFFSVVKASVNNHSLLFSAEVDGQDICHKQEAPACYVELKTSKLPRDGMDIHSLPKLKWWAQSFLAGIPRIIVGFKKDEHNVVKCVMFNVTEDGLRQAAAGTREIPDYWRPAVCMNFLDAFLSFVKQVVTEDNHEVVYHFTWNPRENVHYSVSRGPEHSFLLPEYVQSVLSRGR